MNDPQFRSTTSSSPLPTWSGQEHQKHLLVVFVHGFKGDDGTFAKFPDRIQEILARTVPRMTVEAVTFPVYETRGELDDAVVRFADWLTTQVVEREVEYGGSGSVKIALCGHSMGGLLIADTLLQIHKARNKPSDPLWPRIVACIGFDSPFLGLHPTALRDDLTQATHHANAVGSLLLGSFAGFGAMRAANTRDTNSNNTAGNNAGGMARWFPVVGGALAATAAAAGAYYMRNDLNQGLTWVKDHLSYVKHLWEEDQLRDRMADLIDLDRHHGIIFRAFYVQLPTDSLEGKLFVLVPERHHLAFPYFVRAGNMKAQTPVQGHLSMFDPNTNDGYYQLGLDAVKLIQEAATRD